MKTLIITLLFFVLLSPIYAGSVSGDLMQWHKTEITFDGPSVSESSSTFLDYRLNVTFTGPSGQTYIVPGFFAADGNSSESSANSGNKWQVRFTPDEVGQWSYTASFRTGTQVAIDLNANAGTATSFDGDAGTFTIAASNKTGSDFRSKGMLRYVGEHYLQHAGSEEYFVKGGAGSPENFLAYADFDNTYDNGGTYFPALGDNQLHQYDPHQGDWNNGDPSWQNGKGKNIIGALNYISSKGINAAYIILMNEEGDGRDVWPWIAHNNREVFDVSKLDQWEIVFSHMDEVGMMADIMLTETENENLLENYDGGPFSYTRKLYYREMVARFGHHLGMCWNIGEENGNSTQQVKDFSKYIKDTDPYDHHIVAHTWPGADEAVFGPLLGYQYFDGMSVQTGHNYNGHVSHWIDRSVAAGKKWVIAIDEPLGWEYGCRPDSEDPNHDTPRKEVLWGTLMAGGAGVDWYFGWQNNAPTSDLSNEDWRSRNNMWEQTGHALDFFKNIPVHKMTENNNLEAGDNDYVFARTGEEYVIYLKNGGSPNIDLTATSGAFEVKWFDPRNGGSLQNGNILEVNAGSSVNLGSAPNNTSSDWVVYLTSINDAPRFQLSESSTSYTMNLADYSSITPASKSILISNSGIGELQNVTATSNANWVTTSFIDNEGNDQNLTIALNANASSLAIGTHTTQITISGDVASNAIISVSLSVLDPNNLPYLEQNGIVVMECESATMTGNWHIRTDHAGYSGTGYVNFEPSGTNFNPNDANQTLEYKFIINTPGTYNVEIRNYIPNNDMTESNDVFFRMDDNTTWKSFSHTTWQWNWNFTHDDGHENFSETEYTLTAGEHTIYLIGRSEDFGLDRIHIFNSDVVNPLDHTIPESAKNYTSPVLSANVTSLDITMDQGDNSSVSGSNSININNSGIDTLEDVTATTQTDWLDISFSDNEGNEQAFEVNINTNANQLSFGTHTASVIIDGSNADPTSITVNLLVEDPNQVKLDITSAMASYEQGALVAANTIDNNMSTRWASNGDPLSPNGWIYFDLGSPKTISKVTIEWEAAYANNYIIQVSDDAMSWTDVHNVTNSNGGNEELNIFGAGQYVRILGQANATTYGMSIYEVEIYGSDISTETSELMSGLECLVYPNPSSSVINIETQENIIAVEIYNMIGEKVMIASGQQQTFDISQLASGSYILSIISNKETYYKRIIKN